MLKFKKFPLGTRNELFKTLCLSRLNYASFLYNSEFSSKNLQNKFAEIYYKSLRTTIGIGKRSNREKILYHMGIQSAEEITEINLLTIIKRWD